MKKLRLMLASSLCALSLHAGANFGISQAMFADGDPGYGFDLGTEWMFYKPQKLHGAEFGIGTDMLFFSLGKVKGLEDDAGMAVNFDLLAGYSFAEHGAPVTLVAGVGYGVGQIGSDYFDGLTYEGAAEYDFSETKGIGFKYCHNNADLLLAGGKSDLENYILYFKYTRK